MAWSTTCWEVTPPLPTAASLRTMKMACSKICGSGESTTMTRRESPFTKSYALLCCDFV